jgi:hypothetical protein
MWWFLLTKYQPGLVQQMVGEKKHGELPYQSLNNK